MVWDGKERRRYKRVSLNLLLEFDDPSAPGSSRTTRMETLNFSAGGFYCRLSRQIQPLTRLALGFVFPPFGADHECERVIDCEAVVVRCEPERGASGQFRVGACFTSLSAEDRNYIEEYMDWYEAVYGEGREPEEDAPVEEDEEVA
jgi:c-di-GMP-binding flagellar brake protein YcgR